MKTYFILHVVHKTEEGKLQSIGYRYGSENLPDDLYYPLSDITEQALNLARESGLDPTRVVFTPFTYIVADTKENTKNACRVINQNNVKCVWAAEGYSLEDTEYLYGVPFDFEFTVVNPNGEKIEL